jgi:hypothetical protein
VVPVITLLIPEPSPSLNDWNYQPHWSKYARIKKHWFALVMVAKSQAHVRTPAPQHANVHVTRFGKKNLDLSNARGGLKPLEDALKFHGLIVDDDPQHLTLTFEQCVVEVGDPPCTRVQISPG